MLRANMTICGLALVFTIVSVFADDQPPPPPRGPDAACIHQAGKSVEALESISGMNRSFGSAFMLREEHEVVVWRFSPSPSNDFQRPGDLSLPFYEVRARRPSCAILAIEYFEREYD